MTRRCEDCDADISWRPKIAYLCIACSAARRVEHIRRQSREYSAIRRRGGPAAEALRTMVRESSRRWRERQPKKTKTCEWIGCKEIILCGHGRKFCRPHRYLADLISRSQYDARRRGRPPKPRFDRREAA